MSWASLIVLGLATVSFVRCGGVEERPYSAVVLNDKQKEKATQEPSWRQIVDKIRTLDEQLSFFCTGSTLDDNTRLTRKEADFFLNKFPKDAAEVKFYARKQLQRKHNEKAEALLLDVIANSTDSHAVSNALDVYLLMAQEDSERLAKVMPAVLNNQENAVVNLFKVLNAELENVTNYKASQSAAFLPFSLQLLTQAQPGSAPFLLAEGYLKMLNVFQVNEKAMIFLGDLAKNAESQHVRHSAALLFVKLAHTVKHLSQAQALVAMELNPEFRETLEKAVAEIVPPEIKGLEGVELNQFDGLAKKIRQIKRARSTSKNSEISDMLDNDLKTQYQTLVDTYGQHYEATDLFETLLIENGKGAEGSFEAKNYQYINEALLKMHEMHPYTRVYLSPRL